MKKLSALATLALLSPFMVACFDSLAGTYVNSEEVSGVEVSVTLTIDENEEDCTLAMKGTDNNDYGEMGNSIGLGNGAITLDETMPCTVDKGDSTIAVEGEETSSYTQNDEGDLVIDGQTFKKQD